MERVSNPKKKKEHQSKMKQPGRIPTVFFFWFWFGFGSFFLCVWGPAAGDPKKNKQTTKNQRENNKKIQRKINHRTLEAGLAYLI